FGWIEPLSLRQVRGTLRDRGLFVRGCGEADYALRGSGAPAAGARGNKRQTNGCREIDCNGLLLGLTEDAAYSSIELPFRPGDRCLLYTDGMLEAKNSSQEEFGSSRFLSFLEAQSHLAATPLVTASLAELTRWSGKGDSAVREDDITLIAVDFGRAINESAERNRSG